MFGLGMTELLIILVVVLVLFGAGKLPGVMGEMGKGISLFKKGMSGEEDGDNDADKKTNQPVKKPANKPVKKTGKKTAPKAKKPAKPEK